MHNISVNISIGRYLG